MRYIDIAVAVLVGTSAISGILAWSPRTGDADARRMSVQRQMLDDLLAYVGRHGMQWFLHASPEDLCASIADSSQPQFVMFASVGEKSCGLSPPAGALVSTLAFRLMPFEVSLVEWTGA
jgi:hypothetical protein